MGNACSGESSTATTDNGNSRPQEQPAAAAAPAPSAPPADDSATAAQEDGSAPDNATDAQTGGAEFSQLEQDCLTAHNDYRAKHDAAPMELDRELCDISQKWADHLAATKGFEHSSGVTFHGDSIGENLYMSMGKGGPAGSVNGGGATQSWYDEIKDYDFSAGGFSMATGHFTQVVWCGSKKLGIAQAFYEEDGWTKVVVCANYHPAGNYAGDFPDNVKPSA